MMSDESDTETRATIPIFEQDLENSDSDRSDPPFSLESSFDENQFNAVSGKIIALIGRFGGMNRREATNLLRSFGASVVEPDHDEIDWVIIGDDEPPLSQSELLPQHLIEATASGAVRLMVETELWHTLGLVDLEHSIRQYHTPAMLAELLGVNVRVIRRWHRLGLIKPVQTMHKLSYFDYQEVATARRLAGWIAAGASAQAIERRLARWVEILPNIGRPLDQLSILVSGKDVLLRQGEGLIDSGGQLRFDFEPASENHTEVDAVREPIVKFEVDRACEIETLPTDDLLLQAYAAEDDQQWDTAIDLYHTILARDGPRADISFQIAEILYREGQLIAARERYYMAIELDPDLVEARASLGVVLMETGQLEFAISAFQGTLKMHEKYADVHYNLARTLDRVGRANEAINHWKRFLELAPDSPWASEAQERVMERENL